MHSTWTLSSEGSLEAFSIRYCTACFALLSQTGLLLALLSLGTICLMYYLSRPLNLISDLTGANGDKYFGLPAKNDAMAKEHLKGRLQRKSGKSIPIYPNGWFGILESSEIGRNEIKYVMAFGKNVAVFRMSDGTVQVVNTCCPHLRVNMGLEGRAKTYIECPSHGWQFDGETKIWNKIQGVKKVSDMAEVQTFRSVEVNQIIFLWYHAEGEEPSYKIQPLKEITSEGYMYVGRHECLTDAHNEDIVQNAADNTHLIVVHAPKMALVGADLDGFWSKWLLLLGNANPKSVWEPDADNSHMSWNRIELLVELFKKISVLHSNQLKCVGPGYIEVTAVFGKVKIYTTVCITPIGPLTVRITLRTYGRPLHILIGRFLLRSISNVLEQDAAIWKYGKPRLHQNVVKEEGSLINYRRWYSQFYSKNSVSLDCEQRDICE